MVFDQNVQYLSMAFWQIVVVAGPILLVALSVGLFIGLIQAATSINEMTLSFVPKLFIVLMAMSLMATFTITQMTDYFSYIFDEISRKGRGSSGTGVTRAFYFFGFNTDSLVTSRCVLDFSALFWW